MCPSSIDTNPRAVLWDLDGTLIDSATLHWKAWEETLAPLGVPMDAAYFVAAFGRRNDEILHGLLGSEPDPALVERVGLAKEARYRELLAAEGVLALPGAEAWLRRLRDAGWRQVLATSAPLANVEAAIDALNWREVLDGWVSADEVGVGKPDPAVFLAAARRAGVPPLRCVVVEDAPAGIEGARRAGMRTIGVLSPHHGALEADQVVASLEALPEDAFGQLLEGR
jgi:HAD superfamily hydrolase (TIGR01509 family)